MGVTILQAGLHSFVIRAKSEIKIEVPVVSGPVVSLSCAPLLALLGGIVAGIKALC